MGVLDFLNRSNEKAPFDSFPSVVNYRMYIFLKGGDPNEIRTQMESFHELFRDVVFSTKLFKIIDAPWTYVDISILPNADKSDLSWYYLDMLLWMSDMAEVTFAYAHSSQEGELPIFAFRDDSKPDGDTCKGLANGRSFTAGIPQMEVTWEQYLPAGFDFVVFLRDNYGIDVSLM